MRWKGFGSVFSLEIYGWPPPARAQRKPLPHKSKQRIPPLDLDAPTVMYISFLHAQVSRSSLTFPVVSKHTLRPLPSGLPRRSIGCLSHPSHLTIQRNW